MVRWLLNHLDNLPLVDKAAGDLQTPFNKAPFSRGLISSHSLLRLTPGPSLFHPTAICLSPLPRLTSLPPAVSSLCPPVSLCSWDQTSISHSCSVTWEEDTSTCGFTSARCSFGAALAFPRVSGGGFWKKFVVKGQADLLWTKVERKRTFDRLKQEDKK